jgi:K(+)-stimulated pyrophosphate-energized sodium pump
MSELPKEVRTRTDILIPWEYDCSNWKRFCYFSSANFIGIICSLCDFYRIDGINIFKAPVLAMLFVGYDTGCFFCISDELCW